MAWGRKTEPAEPLRRLPPTYLEDCLRATGHPQTPANLDMMMRTAAQTGLTLAYKALSDDYAGRADIWMKDELRRGRITSIDGLRSAFDRAAAWQPRAVPDLNRAIDAMTRTLSDGDGWKSLEG